MKNLFSLLGSRLVVPVMSSLLIFFIARKLGQEGMGVYASVFAINTLFTSTSTIGLRNIVIRDVGRSKDLAAEYFANSSLLVFALSFVSYLIMVTVVKFNYTDVRLVNGIYITGISLLPFSIAFIIESIFIAQGNNGIIFKATLVQHAFRVLTSLGVVLSGFSLNGVFIVFTVSNFLMLFLYMYALHRMQLLKFNIDLLFIKARLLQNFALFSALDVIANIYSKVGILLLTGMSTTAAVGLYAAGIGLNAIVSMVPSNIAIAVYPKISAAYKHGEELNTVISTYLRQILLLILPIVLISWIFAPQLIGLFYGNSFQNSVTIFRIVLTGIVPFSVSIIFSYTLLGTQRQNQEVSCVAVNTAISVLLNFVMIKIYGYLGAAMVAAVSPALLLLMQWRFLRKKGLSLRITVETAKYLCVLAVWALSVYGLQQITIIPFTVSIAFSCLLYLAVILNVGGFLTRAERSIFNTNRYFKIFCIRGLCPDHGLEELK